MVGAQAIIADVVPPRDRGRYMGLIGSVFAVASVAGPLLGGFFVEAISWRWVFYVNLPIGFVAVAIIVLKLHLHVPHQRHAVDYLGAALLTAGVCALILVTTWGGNQYDWASVEIIGLVVVALIGVLAFVRAESRATEPILPLGLLRNRVVAIASAVGFIIGFALFGALTYLPLFQQVVRGASPTESGLQLIPVMAGVLIGSVGSGQAITKTGRYKVFPIAGTALSVIGMLLLAQLDAGTSNLYAYAAMFVLGLGLGLVMQVLVLATQNAVDYDDLGVATSSASLFRSMGGSLGTAALGAVFTARLTDELAGTPAARVTGGAANPAAIQQLPAAIRDTYTGAFSNSLDTVFLVGAAILAVAFLLSWLIEERPLRQTVETAGVGEAFAAPSSGDSLRELTRELARLLGRERSQAFIERTADASGVGLPAPAAWLLVQAHEGADLDDPDAITKNRPIDANWVREQVDLLNERGLVDHHYLTERGYATAEHLLGTARDSLGALVADWTPDEDPRLNDAIARIAHELASEAPAPV
jgi:MFS family permease